MKILFVNDYAIPQGGAEILVLNLRAAMRKRGHDARLFASNAGKKGPEKLADYRCVGTTSRFRTLLQTANPFAAISLKRALDEFRPDVVHVKMFLTQLSPLILPVLRRFPTLYHVVWYRPICPLGTKMLPDRSVCYSPPGFVCHRTGCLPWHNWILLMTQLRLLRRWRHVFDLVVANSSHVRERLLAEGMGPAQVVHNGIRPCQPRSSFSSVPKIAFAGRLVREKGVDVLFRAFSIVKQRIPDATLAICGDGPEHGPLVDLASRLGLNGSISMLGFQPVNAIHEVFRDSWAVVVPSVWEEPFGHVSIEAMMNGVPVVVANTGGLREIVRDGETGFLCVPGDPASLAAALLKLLMDRSLTERLGASAHQCAVQRFNEDRLTDQFLQLYQSISPRVTA